MPRADSKGRLRRLELLAAQLKQDELCTVKSLAKTHGVSQRTILRDLNLMRDQGLPIDADRGRGGGVRLDRNWGVGRLNLSYTEAVDMLISIAVAEQMKSPLFLASLSSVRRQLVASFAPDKRSRVNRIKSRVLVGNTASVPVQTTVEPPASRVLRSLNECFLNQTSMIVRYRDEAGQITRREIEPHYLLLKYPVWYVLAVDHLRGAPRTFRTDRIVLAESTRTAFRLLPKDRFTPVFEDSGELI